MTFDDMARISDSIEQSVIKLESMGFDARDMKNISSINRRLEKIISIFEKLPTKIIIAFILSGAGIMFFAQSIFSQNDYSMETKNFGSKKYKVYKFVDSAIIDNNKTIYIQIKD